MDSDLNTLFISLIYVNNLVELYRFLQAHKINPVMHRDTKGGTALHIATLSSASSMVQFLIRYVSEHFPERPDEMIKSWINVTNNEGSTCFLYAIYRGNLKLAKFFAMLGADISVQTCLGLGPMHVAAQSDRVCTLAYVKKLGFRPDCVDLKGSTPLHWAAYLGCETSTEVLLTWNVDIEVEDSFGQTPLQLAVVSGNPRIVRTLLLKGANPNVSDHCGRTPLDIAKENGYSLIITLLKRPGVLSLCGIRPPQRPIRHRKLLICLYISLLFMGLVSQFALLKVEEWIWLYVLAMLEVISFFVVSSVKPGYIPKNKNESLYRVAKTSHNICAECVAERPPRSRHCQICNKCVLKFDHHCPWINNCLGARNLGIFYWYLWITEAFLVGSAYAYGNYTYERFGDFESVVSGFWGLVSLFFVFPILLLIKVQTENLWTNTTTNERFTQREFENSHRASSKNPIWNCIEMCCNLKSKRNIPRASYVSESEIRYSWIVDEGSKAEYLLDNMH